jgi:hypothetical protein
VKHIILQTDDVPVAVPCVDRRHMPDRRVSWRGGRRDSDWLNRPIEAWARLTGDSRQPVRWRELLSSLNVW